MSKPGFRMNILKDIDPAKLDALKKRVTREDPRVLIGFPAGPVEPDGIGVAEVAAVHEFGYPEGNIPERSFMRTGIREGREGYARLNRVNIVKVLMGTMTFEAALGKLGALGQAKVRQKIRSGDFAPLSEKTIRRKGSSKPLIDSGQMVQSVTWVMGNYASD